MFPGFYIGGFFFSSYSVCAIIGIFAACPIAVRCYKGFTGDGAPLAGVFLAAAAGAFLGMKLLFGITNISEWHRVFEAKDLGSAWKCLEAIFGGSVFYGGLLGGIFAGRFVIKKMRLPEDIASDCAAAAIPLFHAVARVGCFLAGCCYGAEWEHGVVFEKSFIKSANGVPRVPVQLIEAAFELALFVLLFFLLTKTNKLGGRLLALYLLIYSVGRFFLEFLRGDEYRGFILGLSTSQLIAAALVAASGVFLFRRRQGRE